MERRNQHGNKKFFLRSAMANPRCALFFVSLLRIGFFSSTNWSPVRSLTARYILLTHFALETGCTALLRFRPAFLAPPFFGTSEKGKRYYESDCSFPNRSKPPKSKSQRNHSHELQCPFICMANKSAVVYLKIPTEKKTTKNNKQKIRNLFKDSSFKFQIRVSRCEN